MKSVKYILISVFILSISSPDIQAQIFRSKRKQKRIYMENIVKDSINGVYIPKDLEDCFKQIDGFWNDSTKAEVKQMSEEDFSAGAHFGVGLWMRNNWGLWGGSRLSVYFNSLGIYHPDDMSGIIITSYHRYLTEEDIQLEEQIKYYQDYWEKSKK